MKTCTRCGIEKDESCFSKHPQGKGGLQADCKDCRRAYRKRRYEANKEDERAYNKAYYEANKEEERGRAKTRRQSLNGRYSTYKTSAKKRGIPFELTLEQFASYWQANCSYCGGAIATIGLDRIDSSKGYSLDNCVSCCTVCNTVKMDYDLEFLKDHLFRMLQHMGVI